IRTQSSTLNCLRMLIVFPWKPSAITCEGSILFNSGSAHFHLDWRHAIHSIERLSCNQSGRARTPSSGKPGETIGAKARGREMAERSHLESVVSKTIENTKRVKIAVYV